MIMKANKQIGFIYKDEESIDKILKDGDVVFERGFLREKTSTTLPITFGGVGKDLKDYRVYGNTYQNSTSGKNLYGISNYSNTVNGVEVIIKDGIITLNGTCTTGTTLYINPKTEQILDGSYNISLNILSGTVAGTANINLRNFNDNTIIDGTQLSFNILNKGFTLQNKNIKYGIYIVQNTVFNNLKIRPQLVVGTDPDYDYEPYTGGQPSPNPDYPQEIVSCGDKTSNLFSSKMELGIINDSGQNANSENAIRTKDYIEVNPNTTYTMSNDKNYRIFLYQYDENNDYVTHSNNYGGYITFTTASNTKYVKARTNAGTIENDLTSLWKLAEGSTVTPYEPYGYKIPVNVNNVITNIYLDEPLRKIGDYSDYIDFVNGKVVRRIKEVLLSSENNWASASNTRPVFSLSTFTDKLDGRDNFICSHFKYLGNAQQTDLGFAMSFNSGQYYRYLYIQVPSSIAGVAEVSNFKTWFETIEPVTLDYPLETPTQETITLPNIPTIDGNNTLDIETEITPSQVYIKYKSNT